MKERTVLQRFHIGVDLGQTQDHTAVAVVEQRVVFTGERDAAFEPICQLRMGLKLLRQVPLGTGYDAILGQVERLSQSQEFEVGLVTSTFDATGVAGLLVENLRGRKFQGRVYPVSLTGSGDGMEKSGGYWTTPRTELLLGLMLAVETGLLESAHVENWAEFREEMLGMRKVAGEGKIRFRTVRKHDDLVFAVALALWGAQKHVLPVRGEWVRRRVLEMEFGRLAMG